MYVTNEFDPTFEIQNMGNEAFQNASFENASFGNGNEDYSCLWAMELSRGRTQQNQMPTPQVSNNNWLCKTCFSSAFSLSSSVNIDDGRA